MVAMLFSLGLCTKKAELRLETGTGSSATGSVILGNLAVNRYIYATCAIKALEACVPPKKSPDCIATVVKSLKN